MTTYSGKKEEVSEGSLVNICHSIACQDYFSWCVWLGRCPLSPSVLHVHPSWSFALCWRGHSSQVERGTGNWVSWICLFLSIRSRLLNWNPLTSWGPWPLKFLAKFCSRICAFLRGEGPYLSIRFSKGSVDSEVKHCGTRWCCFPWILVYFTSRNDRKFKMQREVGGWEILSKQLQEPFLIWGGYILDIFGTWSSLQKLCCLFLKEIQEARNKKRRGDGIGGVYNNTGTYNRI